MKRITGLLVLVVVLSFAWPARAASAGDASYVPTADDVRRAAAARPCYERRGRRDWRFRAYIPLWIPGVSGSFASGGVTVEPERDPGEIFDKFFDIATNLDFAFVGALEVHHDRWSFTAEGFGARMGNELRFKLTDGTLVDAKIGVFIATAWAGYQLFAKPFCLLGKRSCVKVGALAGVRWYHLDVDATLPVGPPIDVRKDYVDPIVGLDARLDFGSRWVLRVKGDVGGFGVGSDFSWWLTTLLEYRFSNLFSLSAGWAAMSSDYTSGSGDDAFEWNVTLSGPMVILGFRF